MEFNDLEYFVLAPRLLLPTLHKMHFKYFFCIYNLWLCRQARFVLPGTSGSPGKVLTMDEVRYAIKNVEDMTLAHEIAVNPDFRLEPYNPPENSLEKKIKTILHEAFWDLLREQLNSDPPCYDHAIVLLGDIKEVGHAIHTVSYPLIGWLVGCVVQHNK